jgi:hypothetical protein
MRKWWVSIFAAVIVSACVPKHPAPQPGPVVPVAQSFTWAVVVVDDAGQPVTGATIATVPAVTFGPTNGDGYTAAQAVTGTYTATASTAFGAASASVTLNANTDTRITVTRPKPPAPEFASDDERNLIRASFCNLHDAKGRVIFTAFYPALPDDERRDWLDRLVADGSTHVAISAKAGYTGSPIPAFNLLDQPQRLAAIVREILSTRGANGKALTPILFLDEGEAGFRDRIRKFWPGIRAALGDDVAHVLVVPGWELVRASDATSADYSVALTLLHDLGFPHIWAHLSPGRASASSNPPESDDPWAGAESGMWKSHGGEFVEGLLYQSDAVRPNDDRCDIEDGACWLNRWRDVVVRIPVGGPNINGWRPMHTAFFEGPAFYFYRGQSDEAFANRIGAAALALCKQYGAVCGLGNGGASLLKGGAR